MRESSSTLVWHRPGPAHWPDTETTLLRQQILKNVQCPGAQVDNHRHARLFTRKARRACRPVHILAFHAGNIALTSAQVPAQLIKRLPFRVHLGGDDALMFVQRGGPFLFELHGGPLAFRDERPWQLVSTEKLCKRRK